MLGNPFMFRGDSEVMELYKHLRIGTVLSVNTDDATVRVEWADKKGGKEIVPLSMPFCEQGWGIFAMPRVNTIVLCSSRPYEFPMIVAYMPPTMSPKESNWSDYKKVSGLSNLGSGEVIIRNMIGKARCSVCGKIYTLEEWAKNMTYLDAAKTIPMELCPNPLCYTNGSRTPAISYNGSKIDKVYKVQMGTTIYMQKDGKLRIKLNDGLTATNTFADGSLVDIQFDENSNLTITGIQNANITMDSLVELINKDVSRTIKGNLADEVDVDANVTIKGKLTENITGDALIASPNLKLGDSGALSLVNAQKLVTAITGLLASLTKHVHVSPVGPTGPAVPPFSNTITTSAIETTKVKGT